MVLYDIFLEEFIKNFKPTYREEGDKTYCSAEGKDILVKDETQNTFSWLQDYPPLVKDFILKNVPELLKPKYIKAKYLIKENQILTSYQKVLEVEIASQDPLMELMLYLEAGEVEGVLVRRFHQPYRFYPKSDAEANGWNKDKALGVVGEAIATVIPQAIIKKL